MTLPKKNNIQIYKEKEILERRAELLENIVKSDTFLPDSILHDDLDSGMLKFVKENMVVVSDGDQIPIIPKILTAQRWGEISTNWTFSDEDGNMKIPFIGVIRKPDAQPGTNPSIQRTIPDRRTFHYTTIPTWNGTQMGADVYKIPQPVAVDIGFEVTIVCQKFRDLNRFNKIVLLKFASRQAYTIVKGHYIPIVLDRISDNSPIDSLDTRKHYIQSYEFTMLGFLIDSEEFEIKPAINRLFLLNEFVDTKNYEKKSIQTSIEVKVVTFIADGIQTVFSVGETIGYLFFVSINGNLQDRNIHYYWMGQTSRITFVSPPVTGSRITVSYYAGRSNIFQDSYGNLLFLEMETFTYTNSLNFTVNHNIDSIMYLTVNGLIDNEGVGYSVSGNTVTLLTAPVDDSIITISYLR